MINLMRKMVIHKWRTIVSMSTLLFFVPGPVVHRHRSSHITSTPWPNYAPVKCVSLSRRWSLFFSSLRSPNEIDFEEMFRVLNIRNFDCKQKIICEIEQFVASQGVAGFILNFFRYATIYRHSYVLNLQPSISVSIPFPFAERSYKVLK